MPQKDKNNPFETLMGQQILDNINEAKEHNFGELINDEKLIKEVKRGQIDYEKYQQQQTYEASLQPLLIRLDEIIKLLEDVLERL